VRGILSHLEHSKNLCSLSSLTSPMTLLVAQIVLCLHLLSYDPASRYDDAQLTIAPVLAVQYRGKHCGVAPPKVSAADVEI
jgi:hypothetical protein